jgi:hypothetical protein
VILAPGVGGGVPGPVAKRADAVIAECDTKLARYQAALDAGADPVAVAGWTKAVTVERAAALARSATRRPLQAAGKLTDEAIEHIVQALGDIAELLRAADAEGRARIYDRLELRLTYKPAEGLIHARANLDPHGRGGMGSVRGGT